MEQLTCNIDLSCSLYYLFFSLVLLEIKPLVLKGKVLGEKFLKMCENVRYFQNPCARDPPARNFQKL